MAFTRASLEWAERSGGAFDATGGPLFDLWNRVRKNENVPTDEAIPDCMDTVGYDKVRVTENTVFLTEPGMRLGFGGIGKGFAADRAAAHLKAQGFPNFIIDAGGDLVIGGLRGGSFVAAFFMLTDPVTAPFSTTGRVIFATLAGAYTMIVRFYTPFPDGAALALLLANAAVPLIDRYTLPS